MTSGRTSSALVVSSAVWAEVEAHLALADAVRRERTARALDKARLAHLRHMRVDPTHRLVANARKADWNQKLRNVAGVRDE